jgi:hypothetical protein
MTALKRKNQLLKEEDGKGGVVPYVNENENMHNANITLIILVLFQYLYICMILYAFAKAIS